MKSIFQNAIESYFLELRKNWGNSNQITIYILNLISYLLTEEKFLQYVSSFDNPIIIDLKKPETH